MRTLGRIILHAALGLILGGILGGLLGFFGSLAVFYLTTTCREGACEMQAGLNAVGLTVILGGLGALAGAWRAWRRDGPKRRA